MCFALDAATPKAATLRLAWADTAREGCALRVTVGAHTQAARLPAGYGVQKDRPEQLAQAGSIALNLPAGALASAGTRLTIEAESGWLTWDSLVLYDDI